MIGAQVQETLTATGVIATVISLFFAFAALYVQAKRKQASEGPAEPARPANRPAVPSIALRSNGHGTVEVEGAAVAESEPPSQPPQPERNGAATAAERPRWFFRRYTRNGRQEPLLPPLDENLNAWE